MSKFAQTPRQPPAQAPRPQAPDAAPPRAHAAADAAMTAYVGFLAGWFDLGRLAAGRRLSRAGVQEPLLNDS